MPATATKTTFTTQARPGTWRIVWIDALGIWDVDELYGPGATELDDPDRHIGDYAPLSRAMQEQIRLNAERDEEALTLCGGYCIFAADGSMFSDDSPVDIIDMDESFEPAD